MPADAAGYQINVDDAGREALGMAGPDDPLLKGVTEHFAKAGKSQGALDDFMATAAELAKAGLFGANFDPAAEAAKLGDNAEGRRREIEVLGEALKGRGDIDDGEFGELMSLSATAAGVTLIEKLRKMMGEAGKVDPPTDTGETGLATVEKAQAMRRDPRYDTDKAFKKDADRVWQEAHRKR